MLDTTGFPPCRRTVLRGAAVAGVAGLGLTACGGGSEDGADSTGPTSPVELGAASEVPVGGAKLYTDAKVVVAQPTKGVYKAYSAVCTHQGCVCNKLSGTTLSCPCHGSGFNAATGAVEHGPAARPLPSVGIRIEAGKLVAGPSV
ncbi:Rieske (2Fe-2S) protein [Streptomyces sp. NPDC046977]|uniref:Rieske (2Fe-2S) protein n=1 Tax=Streptomyces sp. NPDC046977 TaxID=3154703 RepID=UPI0034103610